MFRPQQRIKLVMCKTVSMRNWNVYSIMTNGVYWDVTPCGSCIHEPHGLTSQKTPFFIVIAVKTSNLTRIFNKFPKYHVKILFGDLNAKVGRENIFKPTTGNESLLEISNDNGIRVVNCATSKNLIVKSTMFPHRNIHKHTWTSPDGDTHNQIDHILIDR
jgi:hypothetical protein